MRRLFLISLLATALAAPLVAQQTPPPAQPATAVPPGGPPPQTQPGQRGGRGTQPPTIVNGVLPPGRGGRWEPPTQNIKIEVTITDAAEKTTKKTVSMLVADGNNGRIRASNNQGVLNVDGHGQAAVDGRIYVSVTIEYMPDRMANTTTLNESISLVVVGGKPTLVSQSADPGTDRRVTVEITATVVK